MLSRCIICLTLVFQAGGHVHLEQPPSAMSWLEDCVIQFLKLVSAWCVVTAARAYGQNWQKSWMFASSFQAISELGALCSHPPNSHESMRGVDPTSGEFRSRQTACYPTDLQKSLFHWYLETNRIGLGINDIHYYLSKVAVRLPLAMRMGQAFGAFLIGACQDVKIQTS